jgi:hypothetical protein
MGFGEDPRTNISKTHVLKEIGLRPQKQNRYATLNIEHDWEDLRT